MYEIPKSRKLAPRLGIVGVKSFSRRRKYNVRSRTHTRAQVIATAKVSAVPMKTIQSVHFPLEVVTAISRGPNRIELHQLVGFENHVQGCDKCVIASHLRDFPEALCKRGRYLAKHLLAYVVGASNGHTYSTTSYRTRYMRVEIPHDMVYAHLLYGKNILTHRSRFAGNYRGSERRARSRAKPVGHIFKLVYRIRNVR